MKKQIFLIVLSVFLTSALLSGQMGTRQAGFRGGYRSGLFYQVTHEEGYAEIGYQMLLSFKDSGLQFTGLKIIYEATLDDISPNIFVSYGYGGHVGFIYSDYIKFMGENYYLSDERFLPLFGADGWLAAEYRIQDIPIVVGLNWKPYIEMTIPAFVRIVPWDFGLSLAYIF
jgi:hypothetical protein